jgi:hypothetical protein
MEPAMTIHSRLVRAVLLLVMVSGAALITAAPAQSYAEFRTPGEAAYCGRDEYRGTNLICWTPNDGFTVTMTLRESPGKTYRRGNRGFVQNLAPVLRFGRTWRGGSFVCRSRTTGLTCVNRRGHGWWLGRYVGYRLF